jgi:Tfp pilus assembly pilus retraction ATPase PilT
MKRAKGSDAVLGGFGPDDFRQVFMACVWRGFATCTRTRNVMAKIDAFFNLMFEQKASDLHMASGNPPMLRINGELERVDYPPLENDSLKAMLYEISPDYKIKQFEETGDVDFGYEIPNISRFRVNFFNQKNGVAAVFRQIPSRVLSFEDFEKFDAPLPPCSKNSPC